MKATETYPFILFFILLSVWTWSALDPLHASNWLLESIIILVCAPLLYLLLVKYIRFSQLSITLIALFTILHIIGAHYSYGSVPFGATLGDLMRTDSNMYDKFVHFAFGILLAYPLYELFVRVARMRGFWRYLTPFMAILALGAVYEMYEWVTVLHQDPETGYLFIGGNDPFDTTKDLFAAAVGSLITLSSLALYHAHKHKSAFMEDMRSSFFKDDLN